VGTRETSTPAIQRFSLIEIFIESIDDGGLYPPWFTTFDIDPVFLFAMPFSERTLQIGHLRLLHLLGGKETIVDEIQQLILTTTTP
jgi:hypothetical protein